MTSKNSLKINQRIYKMMLRQYLKHDCYANSFNSARIQNENFLGHSPSLQEFITDVDTLNISLPYPISESVLNNDIDICTSLLLEKQIYDEKLNSFLKRYETDKKWLTKKHVRETKYGRLPKYMFDLSMQNIKDPDVDFNGNYNWYYTGGILDICDILNEPHLIYPDNENLLCVRNDAGVKYSFHITELENTPIFNLRSWDDEIITIRQKHKACALKLLPVGNRLKYKVLATDKNKKVPYIDTKYSNNKLTTLNLKRELRMLDVNKDDCDTYTFKELDKNPSDSFGQIEYIDNNNIFYMDRNSVRIYDTRSQTENVCMVHDDFFTCDNLCSFTTSSNCDYIFLSSIHSVYKFDLKKMGIVKKWSHMLSSPPLMTKLEKFQDNDLIFISTQNYDERVILLSNVLESNLVQKVPNALETLNECNKIYNYNLYNENEKRLKYSTAGIALQQNENDINLYTCNCLGDVFTNNITRKRSSSTEPLKELNNWINSFPKKPKTIMASHVREVSHVKQVLMGSVNPDNLERYTRENRSRLDLLSETTLEDVDMAAIWLGEEPTRANDLPPATAAGDKVSTWLEQGSYDSDDENVS